ncbi:hypothetical protein MJO28_012438 [Puccinia striiformis f. sp. tritici]|uniref:Uncharacterized protein n=1 Tax=Puccinia striiformis f. sp. tritici TaxID=168172 RepID=A0ACC0E0H5_9BASI|nr:hypothetical protein MJO28_012438 [Puccinia striiformis f. sp. tritici]
MENIKGGTAFSLKSFASPWPAAKITSSSSGSTSGKSAQGLLTGWSIERNFILSLMLVQCALLHPKFQNSTSARLTRLSLGPLIVGWWLYYPFNQPLMSFEDRNIVPGLLAVMMTFKSIEWTFVTGPYQMRTLKIAQGVPVWKNDSEEKPSPNDDKTNWKDLILWTVLLFTSERGLRWSWGSEARGNTRSFSKALLELVRLHVLMVPCLGFVLFSQDWTDYNFHPRRALLSLGVPSFRGLGLLAGCMHSVCTMFLIRCSLEIFWSLPVLMTYLVYPMAKQIGLPPKLTELVNPAGFPPHFGSLFELSSLAHFWGKFWHQKSRRAFKFCGGKPATSLARVLGGSPKVQKACGVMGVFALSGFMHEYPMYAAQREPHPYPRKLFKTMPSTFLFFFVQSFGVILEPRIIPLIPKKIGGAKIWTVSFLLLTAPLLTGDVCRPAGVFNRFPRLQHWTWIDIIIPGCLIARLVG